MTKEEIDLLRLVPGFMAVAPMEEKDMRIEATVSLTKMRWARMKEGQENLTGKQLDEEDGMKTDEELEKERTLAEELDKEDGRNLDMRKLRATDMQGNRRVMMPPPGKPLVEAEYNMRGAVWKKEFDEYRAKYCDETGNPKERNLSRSQSIGLKSLSRKVAKLECIVLEADKGKTFVVVDEVTYLSMSRDHISGDKVVGPDDVKESQAVLSSLGKGLANVLNLGKSHSWRNHSRCFDNVGSSAEDVPKLKLPPKVHKPPAPGGHPQSWPVVATASGLSSGARDLLSTFLEPLIAASSPRQEDLSTEEVISQLEEAERSIKDSGLKDTMAGSLDVQALYPSLSQEGASVGVAKFVRESKTTILGIDWREVQTFLASTMDPHEQKKEREDLPLDPEEN